MPVFHLIGRLFDPRPTEVTMPTIATITGQSAPATTTTRIDFVTQRNVALSKQRDDALARLGKLRGQVAQIRATIDSGTVTNPERTIAILERHAAKERALMNDVTRLTKKMS